MRRRTLLTCCAPQLLVAVDFSLLAVAAPSARDDLGLSDVDVRWLFSAYSLVFGCLLLPAGRLADLVGPRRLLRSGIALFACGSAIAAAAPAMAVLVAGRVIAGAGAAAMTPSALALLAGATREGAERRRAMSTYGAAVAVGFVLGALAGGALASAASWRALLLAVSCLSVAALLISRGLETPPRGSGARQTRHGRSALEPRLLVACAGGLSVTATGVAATVLLTQYLQEGLRLTPFQAGAALAAFGVAFLPAAHFIRRLDARQTGWFGLAVQGAAVFALSWCVAADSLAALLPVVAVFGFGHVMANAGVAMIALRTVPPERQGAVVGVLATAQYLGGALGPLVFGALAGAAGDAAGVQTGLAAAGVAAAAGALLLRLEGRIVATP
jgi:MFS family permease